MIEGVEVKVPLFFWFFTVFVMFLAIVNPLVELECLSKCKKKYVSKYDREAYANWTDTNMQAKGNLTLEKLTHGWVNCEAECHDCDDKKECKNWDYEYMKLFDRNLTYWTNSSNWPNPTSWSELPHLPTKSLPTFLTQLCNCSDFCEDCKDGLIPLPNTTTVNKQWIDMKCTKMEKALGVNGKGKVCPLVNLYKEAYIVIITCLVFMAVLELTMLGLEYVNFDSFLDGRCRFLFLPYWVKKTFYIGLACLCLILQLYTYITVRTKTDKRLEAYFEAIDADFNFNWGTRGRILFIMAIVSSCLTIFTMLCFMPRVERQKKKSYRNDIHGISTESVLTRKF